MDNQARLDQVMSREQQARILALRSLLNRFDSPALSTAWATSMERYPDGRTEEWRDDVGMAVHAILLERAKRKAEGREMMT